jgi:hypothetical protein
MAHNQLGGIYNERGDMKKVKFHYEAGAIAGHEDQGTTLDSWRLIPETWNGL